jgi:hypothetical protein
VRGRLRFAEPGVTERPDEVSLKIYAIKQTGANFADSNIVSKVCAGSPYQLSRESHSGGKAHFLSEINL